MTLDNIERRNNFVKIAYYVFILIFLGSIFYAILNNNRQVLINRQAGLINQTYQRANACIISVNPERRTPDYVKYCYSLAEKTTGVTVEHYGDAR